MSAQQEQANELLKNFGRRPRVRACYPCAKRKIRCHGGEPCSTCAKRGHPEICFYTGEQTRRTRAAQKAIARASISDSEMSTQLGIGIGNVQVSGPSQHDGGPQSLQVSHSNGGSPVNIQQRHDGNRSTGSASSAQSRHHTVMGSLSAASFVRNSLGPPNEHLSHDIRLGLGLQNILPSGLAKLSTSQSIPASSELLEISPNRREVLRFLQPLRTYVLPFYPLVSDEDDFELSLYSFLEDVEGQMASKAGDDKVLLTQGRSAEAGLFLALLAVGIQFADLPNDEREDKAYNLIERSVACLRLSDFLLKPGVEIVQTLVVLGTYLQNAGQSDGAWSLLGLTHRLARSLGLHSPNSGDEHFLWKSILWQDCLLSLRFDRKPMQTERSPVLTWHHSSETISRYFDCMHAIVDTCRAYLLLPEAERCSAPLMLQQTRNVDRIMERAAPRLRCVDNCSSLQQRLELLALRMHSSFLLAEICRPFLLGNSADPRLHDHSYGLDQRGLSSMMDTVEAYLDMLGLSLLPLRNWSLTHEALTCACVLTVCRSSRSMQSVQSLLGRVYKLLEAELADGGDQLQGKWGLQQGTRLLRLLHTSQSEMKRRGSAEDGGVYPAYATAATDQMPRGTTQPQYNIGGDGPPSSHFEYTDGLIGDFGAGIDLTGYDQSLSSIFDFSTNMFNYPDNPFSGDLPMMNTDTSQGHTE